MKHEVDRVFGDRLISEEDLDLMKKNVESLIRGIFEICRLRFTTALYIW